MTYKGMTDRFEEKMDRLYGRYSARGVDGVGQPYIEIKPNDPDRSRTSNDTRLSPGRSASLDRSRIAAFLKSPAGVRFMLSQAELQTGNTFSETRLYNPLFPFGRLDANWLRITRPLGTARGVGVGGNGSTNVLGSVLKGLLTGDNTVDLAAQKSPGSDDKVGGAGRLQRATSRATVDRVVGRSGPTGLLNLLPPNKLTRVVSAVKGVLETGILDVNERPELDIDGQYFSIALWTGFSRVQKEPNSFVKAGAALRKGDIKGALSSFGSGVVNTIKKSVVGTKGSPIPNKAITGRNDPSRTDLSGLRYFIVNKNDADRYLQSSMQGTLPSVEYLHRLPYKLQGKSPLLSGEPTKSAATSAADKQKQAQQNNEKKKSFLSKVGGFVKSATTILVGGAAKAGTNINIGPTDPTTGRLISGAQTSNPFAQNPAEERMLFGEMSLGSKYESADGDVKVFKADLEEQTKVWQTDIRQLVTDRTYNLGYIGGLTPGVKIVDDFGIFASKRTKVDGGRYFSDGAAGSPAIMTNKESDVGGRTVNADLKTEIRDTYKDLIDFMFHDYVNNQVIPFRASLTQIAESVTADFDAQRYIGRTEKNVVYAGAGRELTFTFYVQAYSKKELDFIWKKINYLTGLCFPASYADGFMVPPFVQLTIGNYYVDQPGYIKSINHTVEDNTSWEIDVGEQVPMGMTISVNFSVIEKTQVRTGYSFYGYPEPPPRTQDNQPGSQTVALNTSGVPSATEPRTA